MYEIKHGSLKYDPSITEEIFKDLIFSAHAQGFQFKKHFNGGGETYEHFIKNRHLNFDTGKDTYQYGRCYVIDNNPQSMHEITLEDLKNVKNSIVHVTYNSYPIY